MKRLSKGKPALIVGLCLFMLGIAVASAGILSMAGVIPLSSLGSSSPSISMSVYTNVAPGSSNRLGISLSHCTNPTGQIVYVTMDGGPAIPITLTEFGPNNGAGTCYFTSGAAGYHTIGAAWSNGTHTAQGNIGYVVSLVAAGQGNVVDNASGFTPLNIALTAMGTALALVGLAVMGIKGRVA